MNGRAEPQQVQTQQPPAHDGVPVLMVPQMVITPAMVGAASKWLAAAAVAITTILTTANGVDRYLLPAKDSDLKLWVEVVKGVQTAQSEQKLAIERLTIAVDNLAGIVSKGAQKTLPKLR